MATDGNALGAPSALRWWTRSTTQPSSRALAARLVLLGACSFLLWCGLALLTTSSASASEVGGDAPHGSGLLGTDLVGEATGTLGELTERTTDTGATVGSGAVDGGAQGTGQDGRARGSADRDDLLGSLTTSVAQAGDRSSAPAGGIAAPAGDLLPGDLAQSPVIVQPVLQGAHGAGRAMLGDVATGLDPFTSAVPLSASMPVDLGTVTSPLDQATGAVQPQQAVTGAVSPYQAVTAATGAGNSADQDASAAADGSAAPYRSAGLPAHSPTDGGEPAGDGLPAPAGNSSSTTQLGNGAGSAGSHAYAELLGMLAASRPSAAVPATDADISSDDGGRPSVSPD